MVKPSRDNVVGWFILQEVMIAKKPLMADLWWDMMVGGRQLWLVGRYSSFGHLSSLQSPTVLISFQCHCHCCRLLEPLGLGVVDISVAISCSWLFYLFFSATARECEEILKELHLGQSVHIILPFLEM
jgi:hypothetical protein